MFTKINNSFFSTLSQFKKALILVPHQDDEINVAGSLLPSLIQAECQVYCAYVTNGDASVPATVRMREALGALSSVGVPSKQVFFLGYSDTRPDGSQNHLFYHDHDPVTSSSGHSQTYGTKYAADYCWQRHGLHHAYTRSCLLDDLLDLLNFLHPDLILTNDYDSHWDHRAVSLLTEQALGLILRQSSLGKTPYQPLVLKAFAYATAFDAAPDFRRLNLQSAHKPALPSLNDPHYDTDDPFFRWQQRLRLPVPESCRTPNLRSNLLYLALRRHISQKAGNHASSVVNADTIFWERPTNNLAFAAHAEVSSGNGCFLNDFIRSSSSQINLRQALWDTDVWQPAFADHKKTATLRWPHPQTVRQLYFYLQPGSETKITKLHLELSNGFNLELPFPKLCQPVRLPAPMSITWLTVQMEEVQAGAGLTEIEVYQDQPRPVFKPFLKIMVQDNFIYEYLLPAHPQTCALSVYTYKLEGLPLVWEIQKAQGCELLPGPCVHFTGTKGSAAIKCSVQGHPEIFDQVCIRQISSGYQQRQKYLEAWDLFLIGRQQSLLHKWLHIKQKYLGLS